MSEIEVPTIPVATRTLRAAGYTITDFARHANHAEYQCERDDALGATVRYMIVLSEVDEPPADVEYARAQAERTSRIFISVARYGGEHNISWQEFTAALGGAVPEWRALDGTYADILRTASRNELPDGYAGEAWRLFEEAVADGLEFLFGRRVKRMGGAKRFHALPDMLAVTPTHDLLLVDAKATGGEAYKVAHPDLRPLREYVERQRTRQKGEVSLSGAVIIARGFEPADELMKICNDFLTETKVPLALCDVSTLLDLVTAMRDRPSLRNKLRWERLFTRVGLIPVAACPEEIEAARTEVMTLGNSEVT